MIFSGTSIFIYELGLIGRTSTNTLGVVLDPCAQCGPRGHRWQKVALPPVNHFKINGAAIFGYSLGRVAITRSFFIRFGHLTTLKLLARRVESNGEKS